MCLTRDMYEIYAMEFVNISHKSQMLYFICTDRINEALDGRNGSMSFLVIVRKGTDLGNDFKLHIEYASDSNQESCTIKRLEEERETVVDIDDINLTGLTKYLREYSQRLMKNHTNVCRILYSGYKSVSFGKKEQLITPTYCITLYVYANGLIPLGETLLPENFNVDHFEAPVDVREGFVGLYGGNEGPNNNLKHLK